MKHIAVFTSGGDSPGMNACIRAVVRTAMGQGMEVTGILSGYEGMIDAQFIPLKTSSVAHIVQRGGTILKSARSQRFMELTWRQIAADNLTKHGIEGIVAIGGDGTFRGAMALSEISSTPVIGVPGTIDNDLFGTDFTLGYDTAINNVTEAVDKIRDTADSHNRLFVVEVMGRDAGFIALRAGIACGAEAILVPETPTYIEHLLERLAKRRQEKNGGIIMVAEGDDFGGAYKVADAIKARYPEYDVKVTVLGHIQRGGNPSAMDRVLGARLGHSTVQALSAGRKSEMCGLVNGQIVFTPFEKATKHHHRIKPELLELIESLSI